MTRENRLLLLVVLTYCVYGISIYLNQGGFILPFPLNDLTIFIVFTQFAWWKRSEKQIAIPLVFTALLSLLKSLYLWEILLSIEDLALFQEALWIDIFSLLFYLSIVVLGVTTSIKKGSITRYIVFVFFLSSFILGVVNGDSIYFLISYSTLLLLQKNQHYPIWALLLILELFKAAHLGI